MRVLPGSFCVGRAYNTSSVLFIYFFFSRRTSGNQNTGQDQVDGESEENAVPGDLRHGIDSPPKYYPVR